MHSYLMDMCRSCLTTNVHLKKYMVVGNKELTCFDAVKITFPNTVVPVKFGHGRGYHLCEVCIDLLKSAVIFQRRLSESHIAYCKYMETLKCSNDCEFSISIFQHLNKKHLPMLKIDKGSRVKQTEITCNKMPTNDTYFQDILSDEDLNCDTYNDLDNFLGELVTKIDKKEDILVVTLQEECRYMDNVIADSVNVYAKEILSDSDKCNQMDSNITENVSHVRNIKREPENLIHECMNRIDENIVRSDNDSYYQLDSNIDVKEHIDHWESTNKGHVNLKMGYGYKEQCKNEILNTNSSTVDFKQENTATIINEEKASPILLIKCKVHPKRDGPYKFRDCEVSSSYTSSLTEHKCVCARKKIYKCDFCEKSFSQMSFLIRHKRIHTAERPYKCDACETSFSQKSDLIRHKCVHTGERPFKCDVCEKSFFRKSHLIEHKHIHTGVRPYKCDVCEKSFFKKSHLIEHKHIHTGVRPYKCDVCEKSFFKKSNLIRHKCVHTGERLYKCDACEKSFSQKSDLIRHKRVHTGETPFKCDVCEKSFFRNETLIRHKRIHTGERPFKCDVCEKSFIFTSNLIEHKRIHTGERPFQCDVCEKSFFRNETLIRHKRIHTGERPYKCDVCENSFRFSSSLSRHKRIHTGE